MSDAVSVKDVSQEKFVVEFARYLKNSGKVELPKWSEYVKTSRSKELAPASPDWFYMRCASVARRVYMQDFVGVGKLSRHFSAKKNNGSKPSHNCPAGTAIIRRILQALEKVDIVQASPNVEGRLVSKNGRKVMNQVAEKVHSDSLKQILKNE